MQENKHLERKDAIFETFLGHLLRDKRLKRLTKRIVDRKDPDLLASSFDLCTTGTRSWKKFEILDSALVCFVQNHKMNKVTQGLADIHKFNNEY